MGIELDGVLEIGERFVELALECERARPLDVQVLCVGLPLDRVGREGDRAVEIPASSSTRIALRTARGSPGEARRRRAIAARASS